MSAVSPTSVEEVQLLERRFWQILEETFSRVLGISAEPAEHYRAALSNSSPYERLLALHDDPLEVSAVLTGTTLTPDVTSRYEALLSEIEDERAIDIEPDVDPAVLSGTIQERSRTPASDLVRMSKFSEIMRYLGYYPRVHEGRLSWELAQEQSRFATLPQTVTTPIPIYRTSDGEPAYPANLVASFFNNLAIRTAHDTELRQLLEVFLTQLH